MKRHNGVTAAWMTRTGTTRDASGVTAAWVTRRTLCHAGGNLGVTGGDFRSHGNREAYLATPCLSLGHLLLGECRILINNGLAPAFELLFELEIRTCVGVAYVLSHVILSIAQWRCEPANAGPCL